MKKSNFNTLIEDIVLLLSFSFVVKIIVDNWNQNKKISFDSFNKSVKAINNDFQIGHNKTLEEYKLN